MDKAVSIERRLNAMKILHDAGVRTTCFISPIFPGITHVEEIIERTKDQCNLVWLENLNLRGSYKNVILNYIKEKYPHLIPLYDEIYNKKRRDYWVNLDMELRAYAVGVGLEYVRNDDSILRPFNAKPIIVNYFYHEEVKKSAKSR